MKYLIMFRDSDSVWHTFQTDDLQYAFAVYYTQCLAHDRVEFYEKDADFGYKFVNKGGLEHD